jgi:serine/threonine-protein kinase RsbW
MASGPQKKIFANCDRIDFAAREDELATILSFADGGSGDGLLLSCEPGSGATELLRQAADALFSRDVKVAPFYFRFSQRESSKQASRRFAYEFILQTVAFARQRPSLFSTSPSIDELLSIAPPRDSEWIGDLHRAITNSENDDIGMLGRICLSAPFRAAASGTPSVLLIDGLHHAGEISDEIAPAFERSNVPYVIAGYRRHQFSGLKGKRHELVRPGFLNAGQVVASIAKRRGVRINDECRDLIAAQCGGNLALADAWILDAADGGTALTSFLSTEQAYTGSLFGGRVGRYFAGVFESVSKSPETHRRIINLIADSAPSDEGGIPIELWERRIDAKPKRVRRMIQRLNIYELVDVDSQCVKRNGRDIIFGDYLAKRTKLEFDGINRAVVFGKALGDHIRRAPQLMADIYRQEASIGLRSLLSSFDGAEVPAALIDYAAFKAELKGETDDVVREKIEGATSFTRLPKVFFTGDAASLHHAISDIAVSGLTAFAMGFNAEAAGDEETVWIGAEIESKLEANKDAAEYWCDQLEAAALRCDVPDVRMWLIAPEGFAEDAIELLKRRNAFGSSRRQTDMLRQFLSAEDRPSAAVEGEEYEFVLPMDQDAELIAARAIEDIAKRHLFEPKAVNQIKTALVEAYINASEHSLSPDRKIHQKIRVADDRIEVTISNRGIRLEDKSGKVVEFDQGRRGWGLKLMRQLMDEVRVETVDDGTRITMTKYLKRDVPAAAAK